MPTYEYQCPDCGHEFEKFQSITARPIRKCPVCGRNRVQRLIGSGAALIFKGSGFYQTDYRSESYQKAAQAEKKQTPSEQKEAGEGATQSGEKTAPANKKSKSQQSGKQSA
ncbi:MAG: FmdB family transcriptional regulator [Phycisphaerae bacterium SM23_30]|nr:MAG: FmdB family transcriptional regulator [Phycisphaerae bacterium SM23_30]